MGEGGADHQGGNPMERTLSFIGEVKGSNPDLNMKALVLVDLCPFPYEFSLIEFW